MLFSHYYISFWKGRLLLFVLTDFDVGFKLKQVENIAKAQQNQVQVYVSVWQKTKKLLFKGGADTVELFLSISRHTFFFQFHKCFVFCLGKLTTKESNNENIHQELYSGYWGQCQKMQNVTCKFEILWFFFTIKCICY